MENSSLEEIIFKYRWPIVGVLLGILLILFGIVVVTRQLPFFSQDKIEILESSESGEVMVEVAGAVEKPGVYKFQGGARVEDALIASGGVSSNADREWVARVLNRAAKLTDGQKIFIPKVDESTRSRLGSKGNSTSSTLSTSSTFNGAIGAGELIDINTASQAELESLSGIGPVTAKKIIEGRPYSDVAELLTRKIISKKVFEENKEKLSVY